MLRINKEDHFVGAVISALLREMKAKLAIIAVQENNKRINFDCDTGDYNLFVKYSTAKKAAITKRKVSWDIEFTAAEYEYLKTIP